MRRVLLALLVATSACVIHLDGDGPDALDEAIGDTAAEVNTHHAVMDAAADLDAVRAELARHAAAMDRELRLLRHRVDDRDCHDGQGMSSLRALLAAVEGEYADYAADMTVVTSVDGARGRCDSYGSAMGELLGHMMDRWIFMDCDHG